MHVLWTLELDTAVEAGLHQRGVQGRIISLSPLPMLLLKQSMSALRAVSAHHWVISSFPSTSDGKPFLIGLLSKSSCPSLFSCLGFTLSRCRTLHLDLFNFMRFLWAHFPSLVPLDVILSFCCANCTTFLGAKPAEGALNPTVYAIKEDIEEHLSWDRAQRDTTCHLPPPGHKAIVPNSLCPSSQSLTLLISG